MIPTQKVGVDMHTARALNRMRSMTLTERKHGDVVLTDIKVYDPGRQDDSKPVHSITVRTAQEVERYRRAYMGKYRVPPENVTDNRAKASGSNSGGDANGSSTD